jgi:hypothetical protein
MHPYNLLHTAQTAHGSRGCTFYQPRKPFLAQGFQETQILCGGKFLIFLPFLKFRLNGYYPLDPEIFEGNDEIDDEIDKKNKRK